MFQTKLPCNASSLTRWRQRLGEAGMEELLAQTIAAARSMKAVDARELSRVIVDTTTQEKATVHPTDSRLLEVARRKLVLLSRRNGIKLRQTYKCEAPGLARKAGRHAHARQFKRMRRVLRRQRTQLPGQSVRWRYAGRATGTGGDHRRAEADDRDRRPGLPRS
ncbi:hypothetical protein HNR76_002690 [Pseudoxanthomonas broegbernensis]|nr:hypothetical protein [Pseudoxanthomonas broegbernensis]